MTPETETVRVARDRFLAQNGFDLSCYTAPQLPLHLGRFIVRVPNPGVLDLHDLHHVATGYPTTIVGEAEISIFELRGGCPVPLVRLLCFGAILFGLVLNPRRMARASRRAHNVRTLYDKSISYETLLDMSVLDLRQYLGLTRPPGKLS
ncbi:hypothetical protein IAD21_05501 [Abditibacteriota bacterium]|nr:hypothetical protein IAD21_05501 [Abditibacteriota bacterium]